MTIVVCGMLRVNTFASLALSVFSPFELVSVQKPPGLLGLALPSLEQYPNTHKDNLQLLKEKSRVHSRHFIRLKATAGTK